MLIITIALFYIGVMLIFSPELEYDSDNILVKMLIGAILFIIAVFLLCYQIIIS